MEPEEDEQDSAMERGARELEAVAEQYNKFLPEVLDELERRCVTEAFGIWTGYAAFCEEMAGVGAEELATVVLAPVVGGIEDMRVRAERLGVEPDAELVEEMLQKLGETWRMVKEQGI
jgi:hypothetical protein